MKWYQSILAFMTSFFIMTEGSEEQEIHEKIQSVFGQHETIDEFKQSIRTEVETELTAQHTQVISDLQASHTTAIKAVQDQLDAANARIAELEKEPAAAPTNGPTGTEGAADEKPVSAFTANAVNRLQQKAGLPKW